MYPQQKSEQIDWFTYAYRLQKYAFRCDCTYAFWFQENFHSHRLLISSNLSSSPLLCPPCNCAQMTLADSRIAYEPDVDKHSGVLVWKLSECFYGMNHPVLCLTIVFCSQAGLWTGSGEPCKFCIRSNDLSLVNSFIVNQDKAYSTLKSR